MTLNAYYFQIIKKRATEAYQSDEGDRKVRRAEMGYAE